MEVVEPNDGELTADFSRHMIAGYERGRSEAGYNATYFRSMLAEIGPVATAKKLLASPTVSDGFASLWERGRLDLTVEALVLDPRFETLFDLDELNIARRRLEQFDYSA